MYFGFSFKNIVFYKLRKLLHTLFAFDWTWRVGSIVALIFIFGLSIFSTNTFAADSTTLQKSQNNLCSGNLWDAYLEKFAHSLEGDQLCTHFQASLKLTAAGDYTNYTQPVTTTTNGSGASIDDSQYFRYGGAIGAMMFGAGAMSDFRPASTYDAVVYQADQAGLTTHAQVQGFNQFAPIVVLWGIFRNIALLLFVVVFVAIGFFILIQRKIGGQETVSLVSGVTNAAVAMIFITFSYAIGGIIVDLFTNVANGVVASTFDGYINSQEILHRLYLPNDTYNVNVLTLMNELTNTGVSSSAANLFQSTLVGLRYPAEQVKQVFQNINVGPNIPLTSVNFGSAVGLFASAFVDIIVGIITTGFNNNTLINAIVAFIIFIVMIRVVLCLLSAYVSIIFTIMFAPFILLPAALPGESGKVVWGWVKNLIASALTFPAVFACILMAAMFLNLNANITSSASSDCQYQSDLNPGNAGTIQGNLKASKFIVVTRSAADSSNPNAKSECYPLVLPPKFNYWPAPLGFIQGVEPDDLIRFVVAFAFIVLIPGVPKIIQSTLKVPQNTLIAGFGEQLKGGTSFFGGFIRAIPSFGVGKAIGNVTEQASRGIS